MLKILITGARGQLGQDLARCLSRHRPTALSRAGLDISDPAVVARVLAEVRPEVVLNTAAYNQVDRAEDEGAEAFRVNALGARTLARACADSGALLVHFSTDYVFGGHGLTPRLEHDPPAPRGVYAVSKLAGEDLVRSATARHMVIRTSGLFGLHREGGKGGNFVETMLTLGAERKRLRVVNDQELSPTSTADLAALVTRLLEIWERDPSDDLLGLYHVTNSGSCTWLEFAAEIFRLAGLDVVLEPTTRAAWGSAAPRPAYSVLANGHLRRLGLDDLRSWKEALADYFRLRGKIRA